MFDKLKEKFGFTENSPGAKLDIEERHNSQMKFMMGVVAVLLMTIGLIGLAYMSLNRSRVVNVEIPPTIYGEPSIKVGNGWANDLYLKVWAEWLLNTTANFTPGDVKDKFNEALRFLHPDKVSEYSGSMGALSNLVIRNQLKQTFLAKKPTATYYSDSDFNKIASDDQEISAAVFVFDGIATQSLGNANLPDRKCKYTISIKLEGGHLYGSSFDTDCFK